MSDIALYNFVPQHCAKCGKKLNLTWANKSIDPDSDSSNLRDYLHYASHNCTCGMMYQHASMDAMMKAATESGGDLEKYARP